ncbi:isoaspartyl peptidase/L-asparaginase [Desulfurococcus mucosus]|uniref:Plant-type L-asparaginase n=1 Tax=Desulfurococcus mucosus (strain ATCC 35584 / DSM 2162 / JCM 9187 / O7/1) TaxID=765177 RepID=E8R8S6_DESM0|nr:isoaspartyl peptidase/L-asparaginase [Desulfurococcus mucosus]ADV64902.1 asparaginase [Desulfurococcus mucosus DSM 2162]
MVKALVLHGGAGSWRDESVRGRAEEAVGECTRLAWRLLDESNNALKAVVEAVRCMEDSGVLNAGYGSTLNLLGERSLDAGLMTSTGLMGAVAAVKATRNPILLAKIVAEETPHILLAGEDADRLALLKGLPPLPPPPQHVVDRYIQAVRRLLGGELKQEYYKKIYEFASLHSSVYYQMLKELVSVFDTVGAVAVDDKGVLAAATSTGGVTLKLPGRVGDTPVPGAGFYASTNTACSATGIGEYIIRTMPCLRLDIEVSNGVGLREALGKVMSHVNASVGLDALGFIGVDREGNIFYAYNTEGMLVGYTRDGRDVYVASQHPEKMRVL